MRSKGKKGEGYLNELPQSLQAEVSLETYQTLLLKVTIALLHSLTHLLTYSLTPSHTAHNSLSCFKTCLVFAYVCYLLWSTMCCTYHSN